jgi:hypothetical protein
VDAITTRRLDNTVKVDISKEVITKADIKVVTMDRTETVVSLKEVDTATEMLVEEMEADVSTSQGMYWIQ